MGKWSDGLKVVTVPCGQARKMLTLVVPYYECPEFYARQLDVWRAYPADVAEALSIIVVDDGSPKSPAVRPDDLPNLRLFRIGVDVPWNWLAARNIGAHYAEDGWLLLTDMDHVVPVETMLAVLYGQHERRLVYAFSRREHTGQPVHPHSASFLMTREMFWKIGGYDERLSGVYGTDGAYRKRVTAAANVQVLKDELIRHEYVADSSVTAYERKTPAMRKAKEQKFAAVLPGPPAVLTFPYHEVTA